MSESLSVGEFWERARVVAHLNPLPGYMPEVTSGFLPPPAWAFADDPAAADELAQAVVVGAKTATASLVSDYEDAGEPLPRPGDLGIVLDGSDRPRALVRTTRVEVMPFSEVEADHAEAEGSTLEEWRAAHRVIFEVDDDGVAVVLERFELLYPPVPSGPRR